MRQATTHTGNKRLQATFEVHNGKRDYTGNPTLDNDADWRAVPLDWPCEVIDGGGGETIRGRQTTAQTTHVLVGDYWSVKNRGINANMRATFGGQRAGIVHVSDADGSNRQMRIEVRTETDGSN